MRLLKTRAFLWAIVLSWSSLQADSCREYLYEPWCDQGLWCDQRQLWCDQECIQNFYIKLMAGASFSQNADIDAPSSVWDPAKQGYNANLGTTPILGGGIGYDVAPWFSTDLTLSYRAQFNYRKFQTPIPNALNDLITPRTRRFNLDIATLMWTFYLNGCCTECLHYEFYCFPGSFYPLIGAGVGVSRLNMFNFRTTGLPANPPSTLKRFASENEYYVTYKFTYQLLAGIEYRYYDCWAISLGYRWFHVSRFDGPRYFRDINGDSFDVDDATWEIRFAAQEAFLEFKLYL